MFVGVFSDNLAEVRADVQEVFDVEIIFVTTTNECTTGIFGFQCKVVDTDVLNKFGLLLAVRRAVERADDDFFDGARTSGFNKAPADFNVRRHMNRKF